MDKEYSHLDPCISFCIVCEDWKQSAAAHSVCVETLFTVGFHRWGRVTFRESTLLPTSKVAGFCIGHFSDLPEGLCLGMWVLLQMFPRPKLQMSSDFQNIREAVGKMRQLSFCQHTQFPFERTLHGCAHIYCWVGTTLGI